MKAIVLTILLKIFELGVGVALWLGASWVGINILKLEVKEGTSPLLREYLIAPIAAIGIIAIAIFLLILGGVWIRANYDWVKRHIK